MHPLSRRDFLRTGTLATAGFILTACGKSKDNGTAAQSLNDIIAGRAQTIEVITVGTELLPGKPERFAFGLFDPTARAPVPDMTGRMWFAKDRTERATGPIPVAYHGQGLGDRGVYEARITFPENGTYLVFVEMQRPGEDAPRLGGSQAQVGVQNQMPKEGDVAPVVATPTTDDPRGVDPICTRNPPCSMHAISLDAALQNGKPTVLIFATPAFCTSQLCGPEVEIVQKIAGETGAKANFIHAEVYRDDEEAPRKQLLAPAPEAWKLTEEPAIYYIDAAGRIEIRQLGPIDEVNVRDAVGALLA